MFPCPNFFNLVFRSNKNYEYEKKKKRERERI